MRETQSASMSAIRAIPARTPATARTVSALSPANATAMNSMPVIRSSTPVSFLTKLVSLRNIETE